MSKISFKEFLTETQLSWKELDKVASSGDYAGQYRTAILKAAIEDGIELELKDGSKITIDKSNDKVKSILAKLTDDRVVGSDAAELEDLLKKPNLVSSDGEEYSLSKIKKSDIFGGGGKGSGGGAAGTEKNESLQCAVLAIASNKDEKISINDITTKSISAVSDKFDTTLNTKDSELVSDLTSSKDWSKVYIETANILVEHFHFDSKYIFHRGSSWVKDLYDLARSLNEIEGKPFNSNMNKWNPADIWATKGDVKLPKAKTLIELNDWLIDQFTNKKVIGISLKKAKSPTLKVKNLDSDLAEFQNIDTLEFIASKSNNLFNSKDVFVKFEKESIQFRSYQTSIQNIQGEIKGSEAAHGKISYVPISRILEKLKLEKLKSATELAKLINKDESEKEKRFEKIIHLLTHYAVKLDDSLTAADVKENFLHSTKTKDDGFVISKVQGLELLSILAGSSEEKQKQFILHCIAFAASESDLSAVFIKVH